MTGMNTCRVSLLFSLLVLAIWAFATFAVVEGRIRDSAPTWLCRSIPNFRFPSSFALDSPWFEDENWPDLRVHREPTLDEHASHYGQGYLELDTAEQCRLVRNLGWYEIEGSDFGPCVKCGLREWQLVPESKIGEDGQCSECRFHRLTIPPISPAAWRTMDETLFRQIVTSSMTLVTSWASLIAIRERAASLGIKI